MNAPVDKFSLKTPTHVWSISAAALAAGAVALKFTVHDAATLAAGLAATAFAGYVAFWSRRYPRVYLGKSLAVLALVVSGCTAYIAFSELAHAYIWKRTFQLTKKLVLFKDPVERWTVVYPKLWAHEEQRVSGTVLHVFKPSRVTPAMFFSVTSRSNVGTSDLDLVVEGFFRNLPKEKEINVLEKERITLPSGRPAYRLVYTESSRRIPLKTESLFVMDGSRLFYVTVAASPLWFDRQREYLEKLLYSLEIPSA